MGQQNCWTCSYFFDTNLKAEMYLNTLKDMIIPSLLNEDGEFPAHFQQDWAPPQKGICVQRWLDLGY